MEGCDDGVVAEQTKHDLKSLLSSSERDFLIGRDQIKIDCLKGKKVGLYFSASWCGPCRRFTPKLAEVYNELSSKGDFEVVFVSADEDDESFKEYFSKMPWLAIPYSDSETRDNLDGLFDVEGIPTLVILDENGVVLNKDGVDLIREYGADAYPFTSEKVRELKEEEERARREQTLESILVSGDLNFVLGKDGLKIPVFDLVGKTILLYFSANWCPPCHAFLPILIEAYNQIKAKHDAFEVIFISSDMDQSSFEDFFSTMPWLALPFQDERKESLERTFKVNGIPTVVAIGPTGRTVTTEARKLIMCHGADAYPFTPERLKEIEAQHPKCAMKEDKGGDGEVDDQDIEDMKDDKGGNGEDDDQDIEDMKDDKGGNGEDDQDMEEGEKPKEGWVCDGDVCVKG